MSDDLERCKEQEQNVEHRAVFSVPPFSFKERLCEYTFVHACYMCMYTCECVVSRPVLMNMEA